MVPKRIPTSSTNLLPTKWWIRWSTWVQIWVKIQPLQKHLPHIKIDGLIRVFFRKDKFTFNDISSLWILKRRTDQVTLSRTSKETVPKDFSFSVYRNTTDGFQERRTKFLDYLNEIHLYTNSPHFRFIPSCMVISEHEVWFVWKTEIITFNLSWNTSFSQFS